MPVTVVATLGSGKSGCRKFLEITLSQRYDLRVLLKEISAFVND